MPAALKRLEDAIAQSFDKARRKGKLRGVSRGAYIYGSKAVQDWRKNHGVKRGQE